MISISQCRSNTWRGARGGRRQDLSVESLERRDLLSTMTVGTVEMPFDGNLSAAVYDESGQFVRRLYEAEPFSSGTSVDLIWDGLDNFGAPFPPGQYEWRAIVSQAQAVDDGQVGDMSATPYGQTDHSPFVLAVAVDDAGSVYEASWYDESGKTLRKWDVDGNAVWSVLLPSAHKALAVDDTYLYVAYRDGGQSRVKRVWSANGADAPWPGLPYVVVNASLPSGSLGGIVGLDVDSTNLWVSNNVENRIEVYDKVTGTKQTEFAASDPRELAADDAGNVWAAHNGDRVTKFSGTGVVLQEITGLSEPHAVAIGGPTSNLFVGELGTSQVREYDTTTTPPTEIRVLFGAAQPGPISDYALTWTNLTNAAGIARASLAVDPSGRMTVTDFGNYRVLTYDATGTVLNVRYNDVSVSPFTDPSIDPNMLVSGWMQYEVNYSTGDWQPTHNWRPADDILYSDHAIKRHLSNGKDYMFYLDVFSEVPGEKLHAVVYELGTTGMRRVAIIGSQDNQQLWNWIDVDGDGLVEEAEKTYASAPGIQGFGGPGTWIDRDGNLWTTMVTWRKTSQAVQLPLDFDATGNPLYDWAQRETIVPLDFERYFRATNMRVDPVSSEIYLLGTTSQNREIGANGFLHPGGVAVDRRAPDGSRISLIPISDRWADVQHPTPGSNQHVAAIATDSDGQYFYTGHSYGLQHWIRMYTNDGLLVATGLIGPDNGSHGGWIDHFMGLSAFTHPSDGTHYVYAEEVFYGKNIRYRIDNLDTLQRTSNTFTWVNDSLFLVTNTNDSGPGSLRQAIANANAHPGRDTIEFQIPGVGVHTIVPLSPLPEISDPVVIDGTTQPGSVPGQPLIELTGQQAGPTHGLVIGRGDRPFNGADFSEVRGLIINGFSGDGIQLIGFSGGSIFEGNFVGISADGTQAVGNGQNGIEVQGVGFDPSLPAFEVRNNVVSGNGQAGVLIANSNGGQLQANRLGTDLAGGFPLPNLNGVSIDASANNLIGGTLLEFGNVISGNSGNGIIITRPESYNNRIEGNYIGTTSTGMYPLGNHIGVWISAPNNTVGGTTAGAGNLISGNEHGVTLTPLSFGVSDNVVQGNLIGTDVTGNELLPPHKTGIGVSINAGSTNLIGGDTPLAANVIVGQIYGIQVARAAQDNKIIGNLIGTSRSGALDLGNKQHGIYFISVGTQFPQSNTVRGNTIRASLGDGIRVDGAADGLHFTRNRIDLNEGLGIDLNGDGVTMNDAGDGDAGANGQQNFPVITAAGGGTNTRIEGNLNSLADTTFTLEFFANNALDPSGFGEGQRYLGSTTVATDGSGNASFDVALAAPSAVGEFVTATATDPNGNTSEFSAGTEVTNASPTAVAGGPYAVDEGGSVSLDGSGSSDPDQPADTLTYQWDLDGDGVFGETETAATNGDEVGINPTFSAASLSGDQSVTVALRVTDDGGLAATETATVNVANVAPQIDSISGPIEPVNINDQPVMLTIEFSDAGTVETHTVDIDWDGDGAIDQTLPDAVSPVTVSQTYTDPGVHEVSITVSDDDGGSDTDVFQYIVIYDPAGGFVTGGGWIDSPAGAYVADTSLSGKANFGFVSKYQNGATVPTGQTEFQFKAADLDFHSTSYDWLVIAGAKAMYKGEGTVNGAGGYTFQINAIDGEINGGGGVDKFRIKIKETGGGIIYDNQVNCTETADDADPCTELGGGSIKVHKQKNLLLDANRPQETSGVALTQPALDAAVTEAIAYWTQHGLTTDELNTLEQLDVRIADLSDSVLGSAVSSDSTVWVDRDAAGLGWNVRDPSQQIMDADAVDLLSVVVHELGHVLGYEHDVLGSTLGVGHRQLPALESMTGDANRDGVFDWQDLVDVLHSGKYLSDQPATWSDGDWNGDGRFDQLDIVKALQDGKEDAGIGDFTQD